MEHRWGRRFTVDIPIQMTGASDSSINQAQLANLSITGALIKSDFRPRVLSRVQIVLGVLSRHGEVLSIAAYVTQNYRHGIGVEWCELASPAVTDLVRAASAQSQSVRDASAVGPAQLAMPADPYGKDLQARSVLFTQWIANMNSLLDGSSAAQYRSPLEASGLRMPAEMKVSAVTLETVRWTQSAHRQMVAKRHERIAMVAYSMAEMRGFEAGHETDDWLRAQSEVNAQDAGTSQI